MTDGIRGIIARVASADKRILKSRVRSCGERAFDRTKSDFRGKFMEPRVLHLIPCESARSDSFNFHRLNIRGLKIRIWARNAPPISCDLSILTVLHGFVGEGGLQIRVVEHATQVRVAESRLRRFRFPPQSDDVASLLFRLRKLRLPRNGEYRVELWNDEAPIAATPIWLLGGDGIR